MHRVLNILSDLWVELAVEEFGLVWFLELECPRIDGVHPLGDEALKRVVVAKHLREKTRQNSDKHHSEKLDHHYEQVLSVCLSNELSVADGSEHFEDPVVRKNVDFMPRLSFELVAFDC